jgi:lipopolysaccharide biosynthesis glycosyltransferase
MNIVFCCDRNALAGLHVSIFSLLKSQLKYDPNAPIHIFIFQEGLSAADCEGLRQTAAVNQNATVFLRPFSTASVRHLKGLHGNYMPYARLFLKDLLPTVSRVLYLDSDVLVNCSLTPLWNTDLGPHVLAAVSRATIEWSWDRFLLPELGLSLNDPHFNSGILLIDLDRWRQENFTERCLTFLDTYKERIVSHDQTVLNFFFSTKHCPLPVNYNIPISASGPSLADEMPEGILHFVASPKPWDFGGRVVHTSGAFVHDLLKQTAFFRYSHRHLTVSPKRVLLLSRSYFRVIKARLLRATGAS